MIRFIQSVLFIGSMLLMQAWSQETPIVPRFPEGNLNWSVEVTYKNPNPGLVVGTKLTLPVVQKADITRSNYLTRYLLTWSDKATTETWVTDKWAIIQDVRTKKLGVTEKANANQDLCIYGEKVFNQIKPEMLKGEVDRKGKKSFHYQGTLLSVRIEGDEFPIETWIDLKTLYPLEIDLLAMTFLYTFKGSPPDTLVLPTAYQKEIDIVENYATKVTVPTPVRR